MVTVERVYRLERCDGGGGWKVLVNKFVVLKKMCKEVYNVVERIMVVDRILVMEAHEGVQCFPWLQYITIQYITMQYNKIQ